MEIPKYFNNLAKEGLYLLSRKEPSFIIGMCESGKNITYRKIIEKLIKDSNTKHTLAIDIVGLDLSLTNLIVRRLDENRIDSVKYDDFLPYILKNYQNKDLNIVLNLGDSDKENAKMLSYLLNLRNSFSMRFSYLVLGYIRVLNQIRLDPIFDEFYLRKFHSIKPLTGNDLEQMIRYDESRFGIKLNSPQFEYIKRYSGGNPGVIKALVMQVAEDPKRTEPDIADRRIYWRLARIIEGLTKEQVDLLKSAINNEQIIDSQDSEILEKYGYILRKDDNKFDIFNPLLDQVIYHKAKSIEAISQIEIKIFTAQEQQVVIELLASKGQILSRESVAEAMWGNDWNDKYSDWAIDKLIQKIREKIITANLSYKITTKKGIGFILETQ